MALTEAQRQEWLTEDNHRIVIMDLEYHNGVSKQMLRLSSYPYVLPIGDSTLDPLDGITLLSNLVYDDVIDNVPNIITRLDSDETIGGIDLLNLDGEYDYLLNDVTIVGHKIILYIGDNKWSRNNFIPILDGVVSGVTSTSPNNIQLLLRDQKEGLNVPLQGQVIDTTYWGNLMDDVDDAHTAGGFQGTIFNSTDGIYDRAKSVLPDTTKDSHVPLCLGQCFNIEPVLVDSFNHIYQIHDSDEGIERVVEVRSNGVPLLGPNPRSMILTDASNSGFVVDDTITDNSDYNIGGRVYKTEGTAPAQTIYYYPNDPANDFTASTGTFTANIDSQPEISSDPNLLNESIYDLITWASDWTWISGKLSVNQTTAPAQFISIDFNEADTIHGQEYVIKVVVSNFVDGGTGANLQLYAGYSGAISTITGNGIHQVVLTADHAGRPGGADGLWIGSNRGTVSVQADVSLWSIKDLNTSAAQATAVLPDSVGTRVHRMDVGTWSASPPRWANGFVIGEIIEDDTDPTIFGTVVNTTGDTRDNDYVIYYTPDDPANDFTVSSGTFTGLISNAVSTAVTPVVDNDGSTGQYEVDLNLGVIRLLDHDQGTQITCDVIGQNGRSDIAPVDAGPLEPHSAAYLIEWILLEKAGIPFTFLCQETFPYTGSRGFDNLSHMGVFYKEEVVISDVVNKIISSVGGFLRFKSIACKLQLYKLVDPVGETPDLYLVDDDVIEDGVSLAAIEEPKYAMTLGYRKNWKTQDEGALAGSIADASSPNYRLDHYNSFKNEYSTLYKNLGLNNYYNYRTNTLDSSQDLTLWNETGTNVVALSATPSPNGNGVCYDLTDNDPSSKEILWESVIPSSYAIGDIWTSSILIKKTAVSAQKDCGILVQYINSTTDPYSYITLNPHTGELTFLDNDGTNCIIVGSDVLSSGDWWRVNLSSYSEDAGITSINMNIYAASGLITDTQIITVFEPYLNPGLDLDIDYQYPLAEDAPIIETFIYSESDAQDELDRRAVLRSQRRRIINVQSLATSFTYDIGDIVNITHNRFGLDPGKNAVIIGIEESPTSNRVNLDLWL